MSSANRRKRSACWARTVGLTTMLKQKSLQSQCLLVAAESQTAAASWPCGQQWIQAEARSFHGIKVWKDNKSHLFLHERKSCNGRYRHYSHPSLVSAYCSKDIREMSSMSHDRECQACWAAIGCIISLLLAPIWTPGEELCHSQFSQGSCGSVPLWALQHSPPWLEHYEDPF